MRTRRSPGHENTKCPRAFNDPLRHAKNWSKIKVSRPVITKKTLQILRNPIFGTMRCASN